jgi:O-antigen/teichoic acid export membrane protein
LYLATVPRFSYFGAATGTVLVESAVAIAGAWMVLRTAQVRFGFGPTVRILAAGGLMAAAMWIGRGLPWIVNGLLGVAVYSAVVVALRVVDRETIQAIVSRSP